MSEHEYEVDSHVRQLSNSVLDQPPTGPSPLRIRDDRQGGEDRPQVLRRRFTNHQASHEKPPTLIGAACGTSTLICALSIAQRSTEVKTPFRGEVRWFERL